MTQEEIKAKKEEHRARVRELQGEIEVEHARWGVLMKQCKHPNGHATSFMGDSGWACPDCGDAR